MARTRDSLDYCWAFVALVILVIGVCMLDNPPAHRAPAQDMAAVEAVSAALQAQDPAP